MSESDKLDDFTPRSYQAALREIAIKKNTIIFLPTGSGKTFIAVLVLKHLQQASKRYTEGGKISFVVVNTVALVDQHAKCIEKRTCLNVGKYSGDMSLDFWPKSKWYEEFDKYHVFVMTIQILVNLTNQNFLDLNRVNLIVFDECHRGVSDQPMRQLCKSFRDLSNPPRILGLTATLLNGNCKPHKIMDEVEKLEVTYHSQVATVDGLREVIGYSTNPQEHVISVNPYTPTYHENVAINHLQGITMLLYQVKDPSCLYILPKTDLRPIAKDKGLNSLANTIADVVLHIQTLGTFGGSKSVLAHIIQIERMKKHSEDANLHMVLTYVQTNLCLIKKMFDEAMNGYSELEKIFKFSSDKVLKLISIFDSYKDMSQEELCALVFTKRRFTAKVLFYILNSLKDASDRYSYIKPNFIVGYNSNPYNDTRENLYTSKKNREVLQSFDNKEINVLVASNVLEEGVDITTCSLVVKFDRPEEYRSYIQSKGRARNPASLYFMMVENNDLEKFKQRYREFQEVERQLQNFLIGKNELRSEPSKTAIKDMYQEDQLPPYYVDGPNSARVDMVSAISLLCSYCNCLPCDKYTVLSPELFFKEKRMASGELFISVTIVLPTACPLIDSITGPFMSNIKLAKRAAALRACELLHKAGELDDHLLPKKYVIKEEDFSFLFTHYPEIKEPMAGTNKNKRLHKKQIPRFLKGPLTPGNTVYLHIIDLQPLFDRRDEVNYATFYDIYTSSLCYGLITPNKVPTVCEFPIYVTLGTLNVCLKVNVSKIKLTEEHIRDIKEFNVIIFNDILRSLREFLIFDNGETAETMLLVPVNKDLRSIDFSVLKEYKNIKSPWTELTNDEKLNLSVGQDTYLRKIVSPWYRDMGIPRFLKGPLTPGNTVYLHIIDLQPLFDRRDEVNYATFYDIYTSSLCYGLITPNKVPTVCEFPIYVTLGTLNVCLKVNVSKIKLTEEHIRDIKEFNVIIFNDILRSLREFLIFDNGETAETMLLVPVNKDLRSIDFSVLKEYKNIKSPWTELTNDEKLNLSVGQDTYLRKIVSPWYRDMGDYLVTEVSLNKTAKTPFPNEQYSSYEDYFLDKHGVRLVNPQLPLLYVKSLTKKVNFIKPQGAQAKRKKEKNYEELEIHLIPELVVKQEFPAALWIQANLLPTIVSRLSFMYRLEEFRAKIAREANIGKEIVLRKKPLELDDYLLDYVPHIEVSKPVNVLVPEPKDDLPISFVSNINVNKDYAKSMLEMEYPWKDTDEPKDIERVLDVTILDIDYYEKFIGKKVGEADVLLKNEAPKKQQQQLALTYYKDYVEKPIKLLEASDLTDGPELCLIYKAMTTAKANDIVNMERLETLGDSFLKIFTSIYIYLKYPSFNEGLSTSLKGRLVSNKNLYYLAVKKQIGGLMKANDLQISDWLPPGFKIPDLITKRIEAKETSLASIYHVSIPVEEQRTGVLSKESIARIMEEQSEEDPSEEGLINDVASFFKCNYIGDKNVADCVEALLGAYFQKCGILGGIRFVEWMGIIPASENLLGLLNTIPKSPILNDKATMADINYHIPDWQHIENDILGYKFKNRAYLLQALTHASYTPNRITQSYEKLEFLGDAILDFLITCYIFESCGNLSPGDLTDLRSALVNNNTFASLVVRCNLHKHLLMINAKLQSMVDRFAEYIESKKYEIDDEVLILLEEEEAGLNLAEYIDVPKVLGDIFEALVGAIYLDCGKDLKTVWKVFYRIMWKEIEAFSANVPKNLIRKLYEWNPNPHPKFGLSVDAEKGRVMMPLQFMLNGRKQQVYGFGSNKSMAKKAAAKLALRQLS